MKRNLYGSIKAMPYTSGTAVDRQGRIRKCKRGRNAGCGRHRV